MPRRSVVVVGGSGFLGANLVRKLVESEECHCTVIDNESGLGNARPLPSMAKAISADAGSGEAWREVGRPDVAFYLAARVANISYNATHQAEMLHANLAALAGLVSVYRSAPRAIVYVSTACVYPAGAPVPTPEAWGTRETPEGTNLGYGTAKRAGEQLAALLWQETGIPTVIVRPFNLYGPWDLFDPQWGHFVPSMLYRMLRGDAQIPVWGGTQSRAFTFVDDAVEILIRLAADARGLRVVNLGHAMEVRIANAVDLLRSATEFSGDTASQDGPLGYMRRAADEAFLSSLIGPFNWTPFEEGVRRTVSWCRSQGLGSLPQARRS